MSNVYIINMPGDKDKKYEQFQYPGGEIQVRILEKEIRKIEEAEQVVLISRISNGEIINLSLLTDALFFLNGEARYSLILPYLPYSRADRRFVPGDCGGLFRFGKLLDSLCFNEVITLDVHSYRAHRCISNLVNVEPTCLIESALKVVNSLDTTLLYTDEGGVTRYKLEKFGMQTNFCQKKRDNKTGQLSGFKVPAIKTSNVLLVDDICDGGGTFVGIAKELLKQQPDLTLHLYVTHGIFSKGFHSSELNTYFTEIITSDSFQSRYYVVDYQNNLTVIPIDGLLKSKVLTTKQSYDSIAG